MQESEERTHYNRYGAHPNAEGCTVGQKPFIVRSRRRESSKKREPAYLGASRSMSEVYSMTREEYEKRTAATRRARIAWWEEAKFGLFIHYGIYSAYGRGEWIKLREGISREEYLRTAEEKMTYKTGTAEEWVRCAADAGMRYAILTTQHHDGFSLWDSAVNPYNSVAYGPRVDIVREFCDACRKYGLRIGLYFSLLNWEHPDGAVCATDEAARVRFVSDVRERVRELMMKSRLSLTFKQVLNSKKPR